MSPTHLYLLFYLFFAVDTASSSTGRCKSCFHEQEIQAIKAFININKQSVMLLRIFHYRNCKSDSSVYLPATRKVSILKKVSQGKRIGHILCAQLTVFGFGMFKNNELLSG